MRRFFSNIFTIRRPKSFIAVDIGSDSAISSLLLEAAGSETRLIERLQFELPHQRDSGDFVPVIREYLRQILNGYIKELGRVPQQILIGLGGQFSVSEMITEVHEREHPANPIHLGELKAIIETVEQTHRQKEWRDAHFTLANLIPIEITVDGYPVPTLSAKTIGKSISINLLATYSEQQFWNSVYGLRTMLGGLDIRFISNQAAIASSMMSLLGIQNGLIVKIGAEITEVSLLANGTLQYAGQFALGSNAVTQAIVERFKISWEDAQRLKVQFSSITLIESAKTSMQRLFQEMAALWVRGLGELLKSDYRVSLPEHLYVMGGGANLDEMRNALQSIPWFGEVSFLERIFVEGLGAEAIADKIFQNSKISLTGPEETAVAALAYHVLTSDVVTGKKKIINELL